MSSLPNLLWVDLETTGLDENVELPLEIGYVVTDADLNVIDENSWVLSQTLLINDLDERVFDMHSKNGLLAEVVKSSYTTAEVDRLLSIRMRNSSVWPNFPIGDEKPPLCGSSITFDRRWMAKWFPEFYEKIHYRSIDVSSIKELMMRWNPSEARVVRTGAHRSLPDLHDSITELKHYRDVLQWDKERVLLDT